MDTTILQDALEIIGDLIEAEAKHPCLPSREPQAVAESTDLGIPDEGRSMEELISLTREVVLQTPRTGSRRFFNQLFGGRLLPAVAAEVLAAALNNSMYTYKVAGIQILIECEVLRELRRYVGFGDGDGTFTPGGSLSNLVAMAVARNEIDPTVRDAGMGRRRFTLYTSTESHYSIGKAAGLLGIGRAHVRFIETDDRGRMRADQLRLEIRRDRKSGFLPFFINATAGTTVLGAFDPIAELADIAEESGIWLHVDAAFGGSLLLSERHRPLLEGAERANSFTWDLHKMMGVPLSCSALLLREVDPLARCLSESAEYLFQSDEDEYNPGTRSIQCGRRNDALKAWVAFQYLGRKGYARRLERQFHLARYASAKIACDSQLELLWEPQSINVCFRVKGFCSRTVCHDLDRNGIAKVGWWKFRGQEFIRLVCVDPELTEADLDGFLGEVKSVARQPTLPATP